MDKYYTKEQIMNAMEEQNLMLDDIWGVEERLDELPNADVVEVVRCEDCVYYKPHTQGSGQCRNWGAINDTTTLFIVKRDNYCFMGKRELEYI